MDTLLDFLLTFAVLGGMAFIVAQISKDREIGFWTLFAVSVFFTPFIGIIVGLLSKKKRNPNEPPQRGSVKETQDKFWDRFMPGKDEDDDETANNVPDSRNDDVRVQPKDKRSKGLSL